MNDIFYDKYIVNDIIRIINMANITNIWYSEILLFLGIDLTTHVACKIWLQLKEIVIFDLIKKFWPIKAVGRNILQPNV